jgi:23S rRNA (adenine2503-C2)-methyltransferase
MDLTALDTTCEELGLPAFRQRQIRKAVLGEYVGSYDAITTLPAALRVELEERVPFSTLTVADERRSDDGSVKLRLATHDGYPVEAVVMRYDRQAGTRYTACLSSQSGCALACTFCATGTMGFGRNLTRYEILDQILALARIRQQQGGKIDNVVMMGMGEPFHNYEEVIEAIRLMNDPEGMGMAARRIAISTAGWVPGIEKLIHEPMQVKLALSLHAPDNEIRESLMPVTKRFPVEDLMKACRQYRELTRRRIFVEYLLLAGVNDAPEHARALASLLGREGFHVNLIAYNPTGSQYIGSDDATVRQFGQELTRAGIQNSYRISRGRDIDAACGQLAVAFAKKPRVPRDSVKQ